MVAHRNDKTGMNERGALMIEAIALLGLMTMMSPMVVRQTADRTSEMEEVTVAGQMKELKDALSNWIVANYASEAQTLNGSHTAVNIKSVTAANLEPYLSSSMLEGEAFRGNKLINDFKLGVREVCIEKRSGYAEPVACNGADCGLSDSVRCTRYKMTGVVLSDSGTQELDDRRAVRIASMIGADGGYMRSSKVIAALGAGADGKKLLGTQGIWEGSVDDYFSGSSVNTAVGGRVAATTVYAAGFAGDYLYRHHQEGIPDANSMFTDLDMGGMNENCDNGSNGVCNKIKNAGGLEVVGGKIIIRSQNTGAGNDQTWDETNARIALGSDQVHMNVSGKIQLNSANNSGGKLLLNSDEAQLYRGSGNVKIDNAKTTLSYSSSQFLANANTVYMKTSDANRLVLNSTGTILNTSNTLINSTGNADIQAVGNISATAGNINATATTKIALDASDAALRMDSNHFWLRKGDKSEIKMKDDRLTISQTNYIHISTNSDHSLEVGRTYGSEKRTEIGYITHSPSESKASFTNNTATLTTTTGANVGGSFEINGSSKKASIYANNGIVNGSTNRGLFSLTPNLASLEIIDSSSGRSSSLNLSNTALTLFQDKAQMVFHSRSNTDNKVSKISLTSWNPKNSPRGQRLAVMNTDSGNVSIAFYADSGRIGGSFFQPEDKIWNGTAWVNLISNRVRPTYNDTNGQITGTSTETVTSAGINAWVNIDTSSRSSGPKAYATHDDDNYTRFRVDPAFVSVMNDIKITSRGGARLSDALPNYILKGIYVLSNSYWAGPWPCSGSGKECSFRMPFHAPADLLLADGGEEFSCTRYKSDHTGNHPSYSCTCGGGAAQTDTGASSNGGCTAATKYVQFESYNAEYQDAGNDAYRWAHPFMGFVPAPGRGLAYKGTTAAAETLYAHDEGTCPNGYQAVMTVSPNAFEMSKVLSVDPLYQKAFGSTDVESYWVNYDGSTFSNEAGNGSNYNFGYLDYSTEENRKRTSIIQGGTRVGIVADSLGSNGKPCSSGGACNTNGIYGWRVAMGTITPISSTDYKWNFGGIPTNSWSAIAHTYCYFNPNRFVMPNMTLKQSGASTDKVLTPIANPLQGSSDSDMTK